jgi:hypothetical protein
MTTVFGDAGRRRGAPVARALCVLALLGGCGTKAPVDQSEDQEAQAVLAALMEDGTLPSDMLGGPIPPQEPSPRFCFGDDGGGPIPGPGPMVPGPSVGGGVVSPPSSSSDAGGSPAPGGAGGSPAPGGAGGMGGGEGGSGSELGDCTRVPIGFWRFDDCNVDRTDLQDSSNQGHTAYRNVQQSCQESQEGLGMTFARNTDLVYAPDQPDFGLDQGLTVATWVKPDKVSGTSTLFRKRDDDSSAFALVINAKRFQLIVRLASGKLVTVQAPAVAGKWQHVAATYDLKTLRMYIDGQQVATTKAAGTIAKGPGPLLMGNDASNRRLSGMMDNAWFNTLAAPADVITQLTCLHGAPTLTVQPVDGPAVQAATPVAYDVTVTNHDSASCAPEQLFAVVNLPGDFSADNFFQQFPPTASGESATVTFNVQSGEETEPDTYPISFQSFTFNGGISPGNVANATYTVAPPSGCHVLSSRELTIRALSVVDDPIRTSMTGGAADDPRTGAWSFGRLMQRLSPTDAQAADVTEAMFRTFLTDQTVNTFTIPARPNMDPFVLQPWPRTANGKLDLTKAPMRLLAIVNRLDLEDLAIGKAGEGRIVFGVTDQLGNPLEFTVILEYMLPANDEDEFRAWADAFHGLQSLPFPSEEYNAALQAITDRFTARNSVPAMVNGNGIIDIRTDEVALLPGAVVPADRFSTPWQLREFRLSPTTGFMVPFTVAQTADFDSVNNTERLGRFINQNEAIILTERHEVPPSFEGAPLQGASIFNNSFFGPTFDVWDAPGITNPDARFRFALNTCSGCHGVESNVSFLQITPRFAGEQSELSPFLTGTDVSDPVTGQNRRLAELARRRALLESVVCAGMP